MIYEHFLNGNEHVFRIVVKLLESGNGWSFHLSRIRTGRYIQKETESGRGRRHCLEPGPVQVLKQREELSTVELYDTYPLQSEADPLIGGTVELHSRPARDAAGGDLRHQ